MQNTTAFRISAKRILFTSSQVEQEVTLDHIYEQYLHKYGRFSYIVSKESHNDGGTHFHVLLIHRKKFDIRDPYMLDLELNGKVTHGHYKPVHNLDYAVYHTCKNKQYITNLQNIQDGVLLTAKEFVYNQVQSKGIDQALLEYSQTHKENAFAGLSVSGIKKHFTDILRIELYTKLDSIDTPFTLDHFHITDDLKEWIKHHNKTLLLVGNSGVGKTQFCKALAKHKFLKTLVVNHIQDFRRFDNTYHSILVDHANIHQLDDTQLLALLDNQVYKIIRSLYATVFKKKKLVLMITMNRKDFSKIYHRLGQERMLRRVLYKHIKTPFLSNVHIPNIPNIQNHVTNHLHKTDGQDGIDIIQVTDHEEQLTDHEKQLVQENRKRLDEFYFSEQY